MSFKKKIIMLCVLVLTLTLCCFGLVACGDSGDNGGALGGGGQQTEGTPSGGDEGKGEGGSAGGSTGTEESGSTSGEESGSTGEGESEEPEESIDWTLVYTVNDDGSTITGLTEYGKTLTKLVIPETLNGKTITSIGENAFKNLSSLTSITIGSGVTSIGSNAFNKCNNLNKVNYTGTVDQWAQISFYSKESNPIYYAKKLYINDVLLAEANITAATTINDYAFCNCSSLISVTIGSRVTSIGDYAFYYCNKLVEVINKSELNITKGSSNYGYVGEYALKVKDSGESEIVNQNGYLFYTAESKNYLIGYVGEETALTLPENYNGQNYEINKYAFWNCSSLTRIVIPDSVTSIGGAAFRGCDSLTSITIPNSVTSIGWSAFYYCSSLTSIVLPDSVTSIGNFAFYNCSKLTSITIGSGVTRIGGYAFDGCTNLNKVNYTGTVDQWAQISFNSSDSNPIYYAEKLYINDILLTEASIITATKINSYAFYECSSLTSVTFKNTEGWFVSKDSEATSGTDVTVTDATQNATYLTDTYCYRYWKRK